MISNSLQDSSISMPNRRFKKGSVRGLIKRAVIRLENLSPNLLCFGSKFCLVKVGTSSKISFRDLIDLFATSSNVFLRSIRAVSNQFCKAKSSVTKYFEAEEDKINLGSILCKSFICLSEA